MSEKKVSEHFAPFLEAKAELDKKIKQFGEQALKAFFKDYFEAHPEIYGVKWEQYTPYFNDGEACIFGLGSVYLYPTKESFDSGETYDGEGVIDSYNEEPQTSLSEIEDILEVVFGDHTRVSVTRESIETEEYDHD